METQNIRNRNRVYGYYVIPKLLGSEMIRHGGIRIVPSISYFTFYFITYEKKTEIPTDDGNI